MTKSVTAQSSEEIQRLGEYLAQWRLGNLKGPSSDVRKGTRYLLKNSTNRHFLYYKHQGTFGGINLGFTDDAEPSTAAKVVQWELVNRQGTPVKFDEPVALRCGDDYLRYGHREIGGNIGWPSSRTLMDQGFGWAKDAVQKAITEYLKSQTGGK